MEVLSSLVDTHTCIHSIHVVPIHPRTTAAGSPTPSEGKNTESKCCVLVVFNLVFWQPSNSRAVTTLRSWWAQPGTGTRTDNPPAHTHTHTETLIRMYWNTTADVHHSCWHVTCYIDITETLIMYWKHFYELNWGYCSPQKRQITVFLTHSMPSRNGLMWSL